MWLKASEWIARRIPALQREHHRRQRAQELTVLSSLPRDVLERRAIIGFLDVASIGQDHILVADAAKADE